MISEVTQGTIYLLSILSTPEPLSSYIYISIYSMGAQHLRFYETVLFPCACNVYHFIA